MLINPMILKDKNSKTIQAGDTVKTESISAAEVREVKGKLLLYPKKDAKVELIYHWCGYGALKWYCSGCYSSDFTNQVEII